MRAQFQQQQAERHAVVQAQENARQAELNGLKQELAISKQQVSSLQTNNQGSVAQYQNEISILKAENHKLQSTIIQQKTQLNAMLQNSQNIQQQENSKFEQLEKSLSEKDKNLNVKDGIIQGLQEAIKVISSANILPEKNLESNVDFNLNLDPSFEIEDILTVKSEIADNNPQSQLLGEMCNKSTIQVSEDDL
tara:strand:+ start:1659 stop:2237 length:579 start_codon:yes stop_codon:yes gene_type:complete